MLDRKTKYEKELHSYLKNQKEGQKLFRWIYDFWWNRESPLGPQYTENEDEFNIRLHALRNWKNYFNTLNTQDKKQKTEIANAILQKLKQIRSIESTITARCPSLYVHNDHTEISSTMDYDLKTAKLKAKKVLTLQLPQQPHKKIAFYNFQNTSDLKNCSTELDSFCPDRPENIQCLYINYRSLSKDCQQVVFDLHKFEMKVFREEGLKFKFTVGENGYGEIKANRHPISEGSNK